ncbi:MAG: hypothetical protein ABIK62_07290 [candidate division WOR-3 bacterium]
MFPLRASIRIRVDRQALYLALLTLVSTVSAVPYASGRIVPPGRVQVGLGLVPVFIYEQYGLFEGDEIRVLEDPEFICTIGLGRELQLVASWLVASGAEVKIEHHNMNTGCPGIFEDLVVFSAIGWTNQGNSTPDWYCAVGATSSPLWGAMMGPVLEFSPTCPGLAIGYAVGGAGSFGPRKAIQLSLRSFYEYYVPNREVGHGGFLGVRYPIMCWGRMGLGVAISYCPGYTPARRE